MICGIADIEWLEGRVRITELLLVFLTTAYSSSATETALVDTSSHVSEIVEVRSDVLVVLARVFDVVDPSSP